MSSRFRHFQLCLGALTSLCLVPGRPATADPAPSPTPVALDATHFVLVRGDRIVVYAVDPKHGYEVTVVNSALLDANGFVMGQFRPEARPSVGPSALPAPSPAPRAPAPPPRTPSAPPEPATSAPPAQSASRPTATPKRAPLVQRSRNTGDKTGTPAAPPIPRHS